MRLIDGDELLTAFPVDDEPMLTKSCVRMTIQHMPTVDAAPVVHGEWVDDGDPLTLVCGACGYRVMRYNNTKFCPDCGALMDGKDGDEHED